MEEEEGGEGEGMEEDVKVLEVADPMKQVCQQFYSPSSHMRLLHEAREIVRIPSLLISHTVYYVLNFDQTKAKISPTKVQNLTWKCCVTGSRVKCCLIMYPGLRGSGVSVRRVGQLNPGFRISCLQTSNSILLTCVHLNFLAFTDIWVLKLLEEERLEIQFVGAVYSHANFVQATRNLLYSVCNEGI